MDILLIGLGVACVLAAVAGGSLKAAGVEIPALHSRLQYVLFAMIGLALFLLGLYIHYDKPPGSPEGITVTMNPIGPEWALNCPANLTFTGSITITEGRGTVTYHSVILNSDGGESAGSQLSVYFPSPGTKSISDTALTSAIAGDIYWQVDEPVPHGSTPEAFSVTCGG